MQLTAQGRGGRSPEVLLVEADDVSARVSVFWLERAGFRVRYAADGEAALAAVRTSPPQVVVSTVLLPDTDGWTLLQRLREAAGGPLPAVVASVLERHYPAEDAADVEYLGKPFEGHALVRAVRRALRRAAGGGHLPRLLVVDDDEEALRRNGRQFDGAGFDVVEALGSEEACVLAGAAPFDAVVVAVADADRFVDCMPAGQVGAAPWLRLGAPPQRGDWRAVVNSPAALAVAVEALFSGPSDET